MAIPVEATYENGVLKPAESLPLQEHEKVRRTIQPGDTPLLRAYGILGWTGSAAEADRFALDPKLDYPPPPEQP